MTTHCYALYLEGDEVAMIQEALDLMINHKSLGGNWKSTAQNVRARLHANIEYLSGSSANPSKVNVDSYPVTGPPVEDQLEIWNTKKQPTHDD